MRTTVTLDPDVEALVRRLMQEQGLSFKQAVNQAIRSGLASRSPKPFTQRSFAMGFRPEIDSDKTLRIAAAVEDQEMLRKLSVGK